MNDEVALLLMGGICLLGTLVLPLILVLVLWSKVNRLRTDVEVLQMKLRQTPVIASRPPAPSAAGEQADVSAGEIEIVAKPPTPILRPMPAPRLEPAPVLGDATVTPPVPAAAEKTAGPVVPPKEPFSLEEVLAGKWLTWVAALALIIGAGLFFKYSIENQWIGERGRVAIGLIIGAAAFAGAAFAMLRDYRGLGQALAGAAAGILYFALYAAFGFYKLIPVEAAFGGMAVVSVLLLAFSTIFNAQSTAIIGLIGGFLTPLMLSQGVDRQWELFGYIFLLDLGVLGIASFRLWQPLQITAFALTILMWIGWFGRFYEPEKIESTLILMTAFFVLFALLGVWHNALRRLPARGGDLFLMMATPIVYFIALYAVTKDQFETWHGLMAVGLAAVYVALGAVHLKRNPAGKMTVLALGGIAASFITVAVPLQLTGHWIAIAWAAESLLLVELGLKFEQPKLRWAGFGLLCVVQLILFSYAAKTVDSPDTFSTRFLSVDPGTDLMPIGVAGTATPAVERAPSWLDVFNGRSFSFLASAVVLAILAWEYRRRSRTAEGSLPAPASAWLMALVPVTLLAMLSLETFVLGYDFDWSGFTVVGVVTAWASVAAFVLAAIALNWGPRWLERVAFGMYALVGLLMIVTLLTTLGSWSAEWSYMTTKYVPMGFWRWAVLNPRGLGFAAAIISAVAASVMYARRVRPDSDSSDETVAIAGLQLPQLLGMFAHLSGLVMLTTEVYAQGVVREWHTWTALSITIVWLLYAMATLVAGIYYRSATIRILALLLFALTAGKVFLYDVWHVTPAWKTVAFISLGVALMLVSYFYRRHRDRIRAWMQAASIVGAALLITHGAPAFAQEPPRPPVETLEYQWPLSAGQANGSSKLSGAALPPDLYGVARDDLADLRVLAVDEATKSARDIPYVLVHPADRVTSQDRSVELLNLSQTKDGTEFLVDLGEDPQPIREIAIDVATATHNFQRDVRVYGGEGRTETGALLTDDGLLLDVTRGGDATRLSRVTFPRSQFRFYRVVIENGTEPPLTISGARVADREETRVPRREYAATITSVREDLERHCTVVTVDLGYEKLPTTAIRLELAPSGDFYRWASVEAADRLDDQHSWQYLKSFDVHRIERSGREVRQSLGTTYSETRGRYLRITIFNGDDQPLTVQTVTAEGIDRWLAVERDELAGANRPVALYAGDPKRDAPHYDLERTAGEIRVENLVGTATLGARAKNEFYVGPTALPRPWSEEHQGLVWGLTIAGVVLFGGLTALLLMKAAGNGAGAGAS